ncbi:MAG TPA: metallophosphoesterase family protein [Pseudobacteroides sp.]|uniref:metallophosphoesterase family protein n=1 Tax=Pseudobacteroides sp. TaxID=1968840 RepID=UPI002F9291CA
MKIGVISDTHIPRAAKAIPQEVFEVFSGAQLIIHAGDIVEEAAIKQLEDIAPVIAVHGNRDPESLKRSLPGSRILELKGFRIGVLHGDGEKGTTLSRLPDFFKDQNLDCIIFGHSHIPFNQTINNTLYFNPGSPTSKKRQKYPSVGIIILNEVIHASIEYLQNRKLSTIF